MPKVSRFNFWGHYANEHLIFNGVSGALYAASDDEASLVKVILADPSAPPPPTSEQLYWLLNEGGFIISSDVEENNLLLQRSESECLSQRILELIIAPTYSCNFRCRYCKGPFTPGTMSLSSEDRVVRYIASKISDYTEVQVSWFGGEPLLCLPTVVRISRQLRALADSKGVLLRLLISTNGYLLRLPAAKALFEAGVHFFHVTVDGPASCHDRLRVLTNGEVTYYAIMDNLRNLLKEIPGAHLTLRINVNDGNVEYAAEVLDQIAEESRARVQVNVAPIIENEKKPTLALYRQVNQIVRHALQKGYRYTDSQIPANRLVFCGADKLNNFQIRPNGSLCKCSPRPDKPEVDVGHIDDQGNHQLNDRYRAWHNVAQFREECLQCEFLCFCAGGCRLERLRSASDLSCRDKFADMDNLIINKYIGLISNQP